MDKALALEKEGRKQEAREYFNKAVNVTPKMAHDLIKVPKVIPYFTDLIFTDSTTKFH